MGEDGDSFQASFCEKKEEADGLGGKGPAQESLKGRLLEARRGGDWGAHKAKTKDGFMERICQTQENYVSWGHPCLHEESIQGYLRDLKAAPNKGVDLREDSDHVPKNVSKKSLSWLLHHKIKDEIDFQKTFRQKHRKTIWEKHKI